MPSTVPVNPKSFAEYKPHIDEVLYERVLELSRQLRGLRVLEVNATAFGGGVAEMLGSMVPLLRDLGLDAHWQVIDASPEFFDVTKQLHNGMQGMYVPWNQRMEETWRMVNRANADALDTSFDVVVVHDPQPAGVLSFVRDRDRHPSPAKWVWRCHLDTTEALPEVWDFLRPYVMAYDAVVHTREEFALGGLNGTMLRTIRPAIDPLSTKNADMSPSVVRQILGRYQIDPHRPLIAQISRFDPWKDPLGVIDVYRLVRQEVQDVQLLMVASMANDDPEAWSFYERIVRRAGEDFDIHILTNLNGVANVEVNAFQRAADVVMQKSIREGFGLTVSEALWKGTAVVASPAGGIPLQIDDGKSGCIANTTEEFASAVVRLLRDKQERRRLGTAGREHVRRHYLTPRVLADHLTLMTELVTGKAPQLAKNQALSQNGVSPTVGPLRAGPRLGLNGTEFVPSMLVKRSNGTTSHELGSEATDRFMARKRT